MNLLKQLILLDDGVVFNEEIGEDISIIGMGTLRAGYLDILNILDKLLRMMMRMKRSDDRNVWVGQLWELALLNICIGKENNKYGLVVVSWNWRIKLQILAYHIFNIRSNAANQFSHFTSI